MKRIAVIGSAFNPPTLGHADVIAQSLAQADEAWLVPAFRHAWGKSMAPYRDRCAMTQALVADVADPRVQFMAVEHRIATEAPVYSIDLMEYLQSFSNDDVQLCLALGPDNLAALEKFHRGEELLARWPLIRTAERIPIRSTRVRARLADGKDIHDLTTPGVVAYLKQHPLYR